MLCPNCNKQIENGLLFCTECGQKIVPPQEEPQVQETEVQTAEPDFTEPTEGSVPEPEGASAPVKAKNPRRKLITVLALLGVAVIAGVTVFFSVAGNAKVTVKGALWDIGDRLAEHELVSYATDVLTDGHIRAELTSVEADGTVYLDETVAMEMYSGEEQFSFYLEACGARVGMHALAEPITYVISNGDNAVGMKLEDISSLFEDSIFHPASGSAYALDISEEDLDALMEQIDKIIAGEYEDTADELTDYLKSYGNTLIDLAWKYGEVESETASGSRTVTVTLDIESMIRIAEALFAELCEDDDLIECLNETLPPETLDMGDDWGDLFESMNDSVEELAAQFDDLDEDDLDEIDFKVKISVTASSVRHTLENITVSIKSDGETAKVSLSTVNNDITFSLSAGNTKVVVSLEEKEDGWEFYVKENGTRIFGITLETDGSDYVLAATRYDSYRDAQNTLFTVEGTFVKEDDKLEFTVSRLTADGYTVKLESKFLIEGGADMPTVPEYENLLTMEEADFREFLNSFQQAFEGVATTESV